MGKNVKEYGNKECKMKLAEWTHKHMYRDDPDGSYDSYTEYKAFTWDTEDDEILSTYAEPEATRCDCGVCCAGGDCCGNWTHGRVYIEVCDAGSGLKISWQTHTCNV